MLGLLVPPSGALKRRILFLASVALAMLPAQPARGQAVPQVGLSLGVVESRYFQVHRLIFAPELTAGAMLPGVLDGAASLSAELYAGYRAEGPEPPCPHCVLYEYRDVQAGLRLGATLDRALLPFSFTAGIGRRWTQGDYVSGSSGGPQPNTHINLSSAVADFGIGVRIPVGRRLSLTPTVQGEVWLGPEHMPARMGMAVRLRYISKNMVP